MDNKENMESYKKYIEDNYENIKKTIGEGIDIWTEVQQDKESYMIRIFEVWNFLEKGAPLEFLVTPEVGRRMKEVHKEVDVLLDKLKFNDSKKKEFSDYMYYTHDATIF